MHENLFNIFGRSFLFIFYELRQSFEETSTPSLTTSLSATENMILIDKLVFIYTKLVIYTFTVQFLIRQQ